jgi:hypothetical protein
MRRTSGFLGTTPDRGSGRQLPSAIGRAVTALLATPDRSSAELRPEPGRASRCENEVDEARSGSAMGLQ